MNHPSEDTMNFDERQDYFKTLDTRPGQPCPNCALEGGESIIGQVMDRALCHRCGFAFGAIASMPIQPRLTKRERLRLDAHQRLDAEKTFEDVDRVGREIEAEREAMKVGGKIPGMEKHEPPIDEPFDSLYEDEPPTVGGLASLHWKVYLAGPMSGYEHYNAPAFREATVALRRQGFSVISPVELDEDEGFNPYGKQGTETNAEDWSHFLSRDLTRFLQADIDGVVCLPGWEKSRGANLEVHVARELGLPILLFPDLSPYDHKRFTDPDTGGQKGEKLAQVGGVDPAAILKIAEVAGFGARKYARYNFAKGFPWSLSFDALMRHLLAFWGGEENDPESGLPHLAHAGWHCMCLLTFTQRDVGTDDRFPTGKE